jgi:alkylation response protein AidB-like acyl-CoA dehydrogenase
MDFSLSPAAQDASDRMWAFMREEVFPAEPEWAAYLREHGEHTYPPVMERLKESARSRGLWNLFLPAVSGLTNLDYVPVAEISGWSPVIAPEAINCQAPDTGNMEVLHMFGTAEQKTRWLQPLLAGQIRSAFAMTEPGVASSDATNIETSIVRDGDEYVVTGRKWWITGVADERCEIYIVMGQSAPDAESYRRQSMILVPRDTPGVTIVRHLPIFGYQDQRGHSELVFDHARVPASNLLAGEGDGFAIAQARLGPGRIHHAMRAIGMGERALALMAVYFSHLPRVIGPVRSARQSDLDILRQFGRPAFAWSGATPHLVPFIERAPLVDLYALLVGGYYRVGFRVAPQNLYANPRTLLREAPHASKARDIGFRFGPQPAGGRVVRSWTVKYPATTITFRWSGKAKPWLLWMDGGRTVIIQYTRIATSRFEEYGAGRHSNLRGVRDGGHPAERARVQGALVAAEAQQRHRVHAAERQADAVRPRPGLDRVRARQPRQLPERRRGLSRLGSGRARPGWRGPRRRGQRSSSPNVPARTDLSHAIPLDAPTWPTSSTASSTISSRALITVSEGCRAAAT